MFHTQRMNGNGNSSGIYPPYMSYFQPFAPQSVIAGLAFPGFVPLTYQPSAAQPSSPALPVPSFKEVKEELGSTLDHLGRKEKRKLIKNKRNRKKRQLLTKLEPIPVFRHSLQLINRRHRKSLRRKILLFMRRSSGCGRNEII